MRKKLAKLIGALACVTLLTACGAPAAKNETPAKDNNTTTTTTTESTESTRVEPKKTSIGVALYQDGGPAPTALKAYLTEVGKVMNCEFKYTVLTQTDEAANLTKIQELIASNVDGIICTMDMGMGAIIDECEAAGVYLGGYLADYDASYTQNYDKVFKNPYFVGTVADGRCSDDITSGYEYFESLKEYNEAHPDAPVTRVSMTTFPFWAFPQHEKYMEQFIEVVDEYNKTAETPIIVEPLDEETDVLKFSPVDSTYFTKHPNIDAVISFCAGKFTYGTMVNAGVADKLKLFASGYEDGDCDNFGTSGTGTYQQEVVCAVESVNYPLVLLLNKINGVSFPDMPEVAERKSASRLIINSDEDMEIFKKSLYLTGNAADALFTAEDVYNMTALNPDATYAGLVDSLLHMSIEDVAAK